MYLAALVETRLYLVILAASIHLRFTKFIPQHIVYINFTVLSSSLKYCNAHGNRLKPRVTGNNTFRDRSNNIRLHCIHSEILIKMTDCLYRVDVAPRRCAIRSALCAEHFPGTSSTFIDNLHTPLHHCQHKQTSKHDQQEGTYSFQEIYSEYHPQNYYGSWSALKISVLAPQS